MTAPTPRAFRRQLKTELDKATDYALVLVAEYAWAANSLPGPGSGDGVKVRVGQSDPTGSAVVSKQRLLRELHKAQREAINAVIRCQNELDARTRNLEMAMAHLKPGPSARNPRFEASVRGDAKLPKVVREELAEAQARRQERGEAFGG